MGHGIEGLGENGKIPQTIFVHCQIELSGGHLLHVTDHAFDRHEQKPVEQPQGEQQGAEGQQQKTADRDDAGLLHCRIEFPDILVPDDLERGRAV